MHQQKSLAVKIKLSKQANKYYIAYLHCQSHYASLMRAPKIVRAQYPSTHYTNQDETPHFFLHTVHNKRF